MATSVQYRMILIIPMAAPELGINWVIIKTVNEETDTMCDSYLKDVQLVMWAIKFQSIIVTMIRL